MEADLSMFALVARASVLVQIVMAILLSASVLSWVLIVIKFRVIRQAREEARRFEDRFWSGVNLTDLYQSVRRHGEDHGMARIFEAGFAEYARSHRHARAYLEQVLASVQRSMKVATAREEEYLDAHLPVLATIGSISPYIGLFGTVWGIMRSFIALGAVEHASLAMVAPGIAEALIATAMGLFAAIPAVIAYNRYAEQVDRLAAAYENFAGEFATILQRRSHELMAEEEKPPAVAAPAETGAETAATEALP